MNGEEIRWIVENIFVGNGSRAARRVGDGAPSTCATIRSPIIVFARPATTSPRRSRR